MMRRTGERVALVRELLGLTQAQAGSLVGIGQSAWSKIESGTRPLPTPMATRIAQKFRLTLDFLYLGESQSAVDSAIAQNVLALRPDLIRAPALVPFALPGESQPPKAPAPAV
ncbi:Helix-turn-helix transcriptional regulator [Rhodovastum atsumiense]|nr:helix-turn-helix transcriptional regulator [Rhodovastum atsumiense]CAH2602599.1 Helix-turn-helix transcriptional regulator [Rhodovastum atsumiense]